MPDPVHLFVYGTLRKLASGQVHRLVLPAAFVEQAYFTGKLYDLGAYPGAVRAEDASNGVTGEVYRLHDPESTLEKLDRHEGCSPSDPEPREYRRAAVDVRLESGGVVEAWIYLYQGETAHLRRIESGDYRRSLAEE